LIEFANDVLGDVALGKFHEGEAARTTRFTVDRHGNVRRFGDGREVGPKVRLSRAIR